MNLQLNNSMAFRKRFRLRRRRTGARRTVRRARGRSRLRPRRSGVIRSLNRRVKRLYRINEVKTLRTNVFDRRNFNQVGSHSYNTNAGYFYPSFPVPEAAMPVMVSTSFNTRFTDSTFTGNTLQPVSLDVRVNLSYSIRTPAGGGSWPLVVGITEAQYTDAGVVPGVLPMTSATVRVLVLQLKNTLQNLSPWQENYHYLFPQQVSIGGGQRVDYLTGRWNYLFVPSGTTTAFISKSRILGQSWSTQTNDYLRVNEVNSPLILGFTRHATVLADRKYTLNSGNRNSITRKIRCRRPAEFVYPEAPTHGSDVDPAAQIALDDHPVNPIVVFYYYQLDDQTFVMLNDNYIYPSITLGFSTEFKYRDA